MLPDVDADDRGVGEERVLVGGCRDLEALGHGVHTLSSDTSVLTHSPVQANSAYHPAPAGALDARGGGVERLLQVVEAAERLVDSLLERAVVQLSAVALALRRRGRKVRPEEGVVDVSWRGLASVCIILGSTDAIAGRIRGQICPLGRCTRRPEMTRDGRIVEQKTRVRCRIRRQRLRYRWIDLHSADASRIPPALRPSAPGHITITKHPNTHHRR